MRESIETIDDLRKITEELRLTLQSDLTMVKKAKHFEQLIECAPQDVRLALDLFDLPDLGRFEHIWPRLEVEAERQHAKECEVCFGDERDQKEQFEAEIKECLAEIKKVENLEFPASSDRFVANYTKSGEAFSLIVEANMAGVEVTCSNATLRELVENNIKKINKDQTSRNFLFCTVKALPKKFEEYDLVL